MARGFPIPAGDRDRIEAVIAGQQAPVEPRDAATVAIIRDGTDGLEVYMMRRVRQMAFAAGMHVFPGGSVDPADRVSDGGVSDGGVSEGGLSEGGVLEGGVSEDGVSEDGVGEGRAFVRAAVREALEECDVILGERDLVPIAHWITPEVEPRRYDTHFFLTALPDGQECRDVGTEADQRVWVRPQQALDDGLAMMPPTIAVMADLARFSDVASALAAEREIATVQPVFEIVDDELVLRIPGS